MVGSKLDASLFIRIAGATVIYVIVYVNDIIIIGNSTKEISKFVTMLHSKFSLKDMGDLCYLLGIEVTRLAGGSVHLCQRKYKLDLLDRCHIVSTKSVHTPMVSSSYFSKYISSPVKDPSEYRSIILRYLCSTIDYKVCIKPFKRLSLVGYANAN